MKSSIELLTYKVSYDNNLRNQEYGITPELAEQFNALHTKVLNRKDKTIIDTLTSLVIKYPNAPQLKNFLSSAYYIRGNRKKALEVNQWIIAEHPYYLFGKLNQANAFIYDGEPEKVPGVLGELMEIKDLYPERDVFHIEEITGFYKVAISYFTAIKNLELAENRLNAMKEIALEHPDTIVADDFVNRLRLEKAQQRFEKDKVKAIEVKPSAKMPSSAETVPPVFEHPEVYQLYLSGIEIPVESIDNILSLPPESIRQDLQKLLEDAVKRFRYFCYVKAIEEDRTFTFHSIFLLGELKSEQSLAAVLSFLSEHPDLLEFWLGDHLTETVWQPIYKMALRQPYLLKEFCVKPGLGTFPRSIGSAVLSQIALHVPERRKEISSIFGEILRALDGASIADNIIDSEFLGLLVGDVLDCGFKEHLPVIKSLFGKGFVSEGINGDFNEVVKEFDRADKSIFVRKLQTINEIYDHVRKHWVFYDDVEQPFIDLETDTHTTTGSKIGRNDPCPCGSGKKYKKCCLGLF